MAWVERRGNRWRVRYWTESGRAATAATFDTEGDAIMCADNFTEPDAALFELDPKASQLPEPPVAMRQLPLPEPSTSESTALPGSGSINVPHAPSFAVMGSAASSQTTTFAQWTEAWSASLEVGPNTAAGYQSLLKNHLLPAWGDMELDEITPTAVTTWLKHLRARYKPTTVAAIGKLLSLILSTAVLERLIPVNPVRIPRQRGRTRHEEAAWCDEYDVLDIARRITHLGNANLGLLIITAAYTGMRWGELTGLRRDAVDLDAATLSVHPDHGALHEINGHHSYGPPKTAASVRTVTLPPFLTALLTQNLATHRRDHVFTTVTGKLLRRSTTQRRYWTPAVSGCTLPDGTVWKPIKPGLTFHGLRHSHKTWLIEDNIPDVAQARRLGHAMDNDIDDIYSHVANKINTRILRVLEDRWRRSLKRGRGGSHRL